MSMHLVHEIWEALEREQLPPRFLVDLAKEHLFTLCPVCADEFRVFEEGREKAVPAAGVTKAVLDEQLQRLHRDQQAARADLGELLSMPSEQRPAKIQRATKRYRGAALVHELLEEYWKKFYAEPRVAGELAELAWTIAKASHGAPRIYELIALAAGHIGNAARAAGDLAQANRWFTYTRELLSRQDVRAIAVLARIDFLEGALRKDQRRFTEAVRLLNRALTLFRITGLRRDVILALINLGATHSARGKPREAQARVQEALLLIDRESEPRLYLCAQHNLASYLSNQERYAEAAQILAANQGLYQAHGDRWTTLHLAWLTGRIAAGLAGGQEAEASLLVARAGFLLQGIAYDAALVSIDLAKLYLGQRRMTEARALAAETLPVFQALGVHRETLAASRILEEAAQ